MNISKRYFPKIQIYLNCRNEEQIIYSSINAVNKVLHFNEIEAEIIVVDNCSIDATTRLVSQLKQTMKNLRIIKLPEDKTYSGSIFESICDASSDYFFMLDGDCQYSPEYIPVMLDLLISKEYDIVFSNREILVGSKWRKFASRFFLVLTRITLRFNGPDINAGLRGMSQSAKKNLSGIQAGRLANLSIWYQAKASKTKIGYVTVKPVGRIAGKSSIAWWNPFGLMIESLFEIKKIKKAEFDFRFGKSL